MRDNDSKTENQHDAQVAPPNAPHTETAQSPQPEKRRRWLRPIPVLLALLAASIIAFILWLLTILGGAPGPTFNFAERYNELTRPPDFNEADNAADLYEKALACFREPRGLVPFNQEQWAGSLKRGTRITVITDWLASNEEALTYARQATAKRWYWIPLLGPGYPTRSRTSITRLAWAFDARAVLSASHAQYAEAFGDLKTSWRICEHLSQGGTLEQRLSVSMKEQMCLTTLFLLARSTPGPELLADFQKFIEEHPPVPVSLWDLQLSCEYSVATRFTDDGRGNGHLILPPDTREYDDLGLRARLYLIRQRCRLVLQTLRQDDRKTTVEKAERFFTVAQEISTQTPWQLKSRGTSYAHELERVIGSGQEFFFLAHLAPGLSLEDIQIRQSTQAALVAVLAALRYKANKGDYAEGLGELQGAGYLKTLPQDPYSDKPLVYKKTAEGFTLYSVGKDFKDDGGKKHQWHSGRPGPGEDYIYWPVPVREQSPPATAAPRSAP